MRLAVLLAAILLAGCASTPAPTTTSTVAPTPAPTSAPPATTSATPPVATPTSEPPHEAPRRSEGFAGCAGAGHVTFNTSPMRAEDIGYMEPYGLVVGGHVTPIDHMYFDPADRSLGRDSYEVRAIADGVIHTIQPRDRPGPNGTTLRDWHVRFAHSCTFESYFDLLTSIEPDIQAAYDRSIVPGWNGYLVKAGQLIGHVGGQTLDFGVYDENVTLPGFIVPASYVRESWKIHTVDPFPYFTPDARAMMLSKMLRTVEPRAGKIDHDIDGRLVGNWFKVGTNGYAGLPRPDYWEGHFSFSPAALDPSRAIFSIGNWSGQAMQFVPRNGSLDPANVSVATGLVKIELVRYEYHDKKTGASNFGPGGIQPGADIALMDAEGVAGAALLQLTGPRALTLEVFPGKTAAQVAAFDADAWRYER